MKNKPKDDFAAKAVQALQDAVADVIEEHRRNNRQIVVSRDGKPVRIDPYSVRTVREQPASYVTNSIKPKGRGVKSRGVAGSDRENRK